MTKSEQKTHLEKKDIADKTSIDLRAAMEQLKQALNIVVQSNLYEGSDKPLKEWLAKQNSNKLALKKDVNKIVQTQSKSIKKGLISGLKEVDLNNKNVKRLANYVDFKVNSLGNMFVRQSNAWLTDVKMTYQNKPEDTKRLQGLHNIIAQTFATSKPINKMSVIMRDRNGNIRYTKDHVPMRESWEANIERTVRTEIHSTIAHDVVNASRSIENPFMICSYFGDSRKEHEEYQGRIYYLKDWESFDIAEPIKDKIRAYISDHNLLSVEEVQADDIGLGTWCNCRHTFEMIDIDSVLDIKDDEDLNKQREKMRMNWNGEYDAAKNKALNKQRYYERGIKDWKNRVEEAELNYATLPKDATPEQKTSAMAEVIYCRNKVKDWQNVQRLHIANWENLKRDYRRENPNDIYDLGNKRQMPPKPNVPSNSELEYSIKLIKEPAQNELRNELNDMIANGKIKLEIAESKQNAHIPGTAEYNALLSKRKSILSVDPKKLMKTIKYCDLHFKGNQFIGEVRFKYNVGIYKGNRMKDGKYENFEEPTNRISIRFSKNGVHFIPINPRGKDEKIK